ncbi:MAG TPA: polysaccharide deacetylase family protein [Symbiobacteriaceae bacterium]|nr:polysaccharide deacetylase family protein [Symbiobacteriaceae bacterium]
MELRKAVTAAVAAVLVAGATVLMIGFRGPGPDEMAAARAVDPTPASALAPDPAPPPPEPEPREPRVRRTESPPVPEGERRRVPVLMYHEITQGPNNLYVAPAELEGHLRWLKENGYTAITLKQMHRHFMEGDALPEKPVVLTFDDSYLSHYTSALPLLKQYNWPGTIFVITGSVGQRGYMTWDQLRDAARQGMELGAHTVSHPSLAQLSRERLVREIAGSRQALEAETGATVEFFCYPAGKWNELVLQTTREAGFLGAVTTRFGLADPGQNPYRWDRVRVNKGISPVGLGRLIKLAEEGR